MKTKKLFMCLLLALSACSHDSTNQGLDTVGNETNASWNKLRDLTGYAHETPPKETKAQPRYCYRSLGDVICYPTPIPGQEYRLTAYQDEHGKTGYLLPPQTHGEEVGTWSSVSPASKYGPSTASTSTGSKAASVTAAPGATPAGDGKPKLKEVIFDPAELEPKMLVPNKE